LTIAAAQQFNQVKNGSRTFDLDTTITVVDAAQVIALIKDYFADGTLTAFSATKIQYVGKNVPGGILNSGANVATFAAGACA
jgi:G3E family GTPase